jgi:hypothetical protein
MRSLSLALVASAAERLDGVALVGGEDHRESTKKEFLRRRRIT